MQLRGAGVAANPGRVGRVLGALALAGLAVSSVVLFVGGVHSNDQLTRLRHDGVPVDVTITGCVAQIGGSGSNIAGYRCNGTFTLDGRRYHEGLPGNTAYNPGDVVPAVTLTNDPSLISPARTVAAEHPSWRVFVVPTILAVIFVLLVGAVLWRRRTRRQTSSAVPPVS